MASMMAGEGEQSIRLVEEAIASSEVSACGSPVEARKSSRRALARRTIAALAAARPEAFLAPVESGPIASCIDDDDLAAAGISGAELELLLAGPERERMRTWIEGLPETQRTVFVLRAVAEIPSDEVAGLLAENGGAGAEGWDAEGVRGAFRQALCSLASNLIHATGA